MDGVKYSCKLLGSFRIECNGNHIDLTEKLGNQLSSLFAFLLCNHNQLITKERIMDTFWPDSENPGNALKYAIFRLRSSLSKIEGMNEEWIVTGNNGYQIQPEISYSLDIEEFENYISIAKQNDDIESYQKAIDLYSGNLLEGIDSEWIDVDRGYYKSIAVQACNTLCSFYLENKKGKEAIKIAEKGLSLDDLDEQLIASYLRGLILDKKYNQAMNYYQYANKRYKDKLGMSLDSIAGEKFTAILTSQGKSTFDEKEKQYVRQEKVTMSASGPLEVDIKALNAICLFVMRNADRIKISGYVLKVSVEKNNSDYKRVMDDLLSIFKLSFRKSDVIAKVNDYEYAIFLNLRDEHDTKIIEKRLISRLLKKYTNMNLIQMNWTKI